MDWLVVFGTALSRGRARASVPVSSEQVGLTSWVGGTLGHFSMDGSGRVLLTAQHLAAFRKDPVLGGKSRARFGDFALAVRQAGEEE